MYLIEEPELVELACKSTTATRRLEILEWVLGRGPVERQDRDFVTYTLRPGDGK